MIKPPGIDEYTNWARETLGSKLTDPRVLRIYETNVNNILTSVLQHVFFSKFSEEALRWKELYRRNTRSELFMGSHQPELVVKPFASVVEKMFRQNVLWNKKFPSEPTKGWVNERNLYSKISDLVRGTLVCRFIDGPEFVAAQIAEYANRLALSNRRYSQERDQGYYAFHSYVTFPVNASELRVSDLRERAEAQKRLSLSERKGTMRAAIYARVRDSEQSGDAVPANAGVLRPTRLDRCRGVRT